MQHYAAYLFDLDGTLVDTAPDLAAALNAALTGGGFEPVDAALTRHWVGHGARVMLERALEHQHPSPIDAGADGTLDALFAAFLDHYESHIADHSQLYPHVRETLETLRARGARLAVVTNKMHRLSVPLLRALELEPLFELIVGGDTAERPKPAADPALLACERLGVAPSDALFVGDSEPDVLCARAAGCPVVCVADGYNHGIPPARLGADAVIDSFRDLV